MEILMCDECGEIEEFDELEIVKKEQQGEPVWFIDFEIQGKDGQEELVVTSILCPECDSYEGGNQCGG